MATTRIIAMHINRGKTVAQCLNDRTKYAKNPDKTDSGELITSYACDPRTADAEFLLAKRQYKTVTGREQQNNVIAYQIWQSFKPGEVTPEQAKQIGYELAMRFLKGKHAFIVCVHRDKSHIHSHIIFNSTTLDCKRKFRDFLGSGRTVARLSDMICLEHRLSVIGEPKRYTHRTYDKWLGTKAQPSHRERLRGAIDRALAMKPKNFEAFLKLMEEFGYEVKRGAHITFRSADQKQNIRLRSLGDHYSEDEIRSVISSEKTHTPSKKRHLTPPKKASLLIDIQAKLDAGMGGGYRRWATVENLKRMAKTVLYLQEHDMADYAAFSETASGATARFNTLSAQIKAAESRMSEIAVLKTHIVNYSKTHDVYAGYKAAGYSKKYFTGHESDIILHRAAKQAFNNLDVKKLPTVRGLQSEYAKLLAEKKAAYAEYRAVRDEMKELLVHRQNAAQILGIDAKEAEAKKEHDL